MTDPKPYRPANGSEGMAFEEHWCARCTKDDPEAEVYCPIIGNAMAYAIDDDGYPAEWVEDDGGPRCAAFDERKDQAP